MQRLKYNGQPAFEMLVRARSNSTNGVEFTEPRWNLVSAGIRQPIPCNSGGTCRRTNTVVPKMDLERLSGAFCQRIGRWAPRFPGTAGHEARYVLYLRLPQQLDQCRGRELWSTEAWYTLNNIPEGKPGRTVDNPPAFPLNTLTEAEKADGWKFSSMDSTTNGWHTWKKKTVGSSWIIEDGALKINAVRQPDGSLRKPKMAETGYRPGV